ncbi:hypothetical protein TorRG33x02_352320 [Trema orientale]|uniref:Pentatricopeptide repeat n=1 Tax=Trema orientale TaxID=63057 RepID=A0A2P5AES8_TREOI|nr:hypothetical protein TorRG33x02_352320 [Trema orientale]
MSCEDLCGSEFLLVRLRAFLRKAVKTLLLCFSVCKHGLEIVTFNYIFLINFSFAGAWWYIIEFSIVIVRDFSAVKTPTSIFIEGMCKAGNLAAAKELFLESSLKGL